MEENEFTRLETTGFVSKSGGGRPPAHVYRRALGGAANSNKARKSGGAAYFLVRLGVCALCLCGVLGLKLKGDEKTLAVIGGLMKGDEQEGEEEERRLGKLRFVELPSIIEVFAPSKEPMLPVNAFELRMGDEGDLLILETDAGADVLSPVSGVVKGVGEDEKLGAYVTISAEDDLEFAVYGLTGVSVEKGQPIAMKQRLGSLAGAEARVRVYKSGRPVSPAEVFGIGSGRV